MSTLIHERVELAKRGLSPHVIGRVQSGWAVLGDSQFITGYSLLLPDPVVPSLNALAPDQRAQFPLDMTAKSRPFDSVRDDRLLRSIRDFLQTKGYSI